MWEIKWKRKNGNRVKERMRLKGQTEQGGNEKKREVGKWKIDGRSNMKSRIKRDTDGKEQRVVRDEL